MVLMIMSKQSSWRSLNDQSLNCGRRIGSGVDEN